jgi:hypothetical protein
MPITAGAAEKLSSAATFYEGFTSTEQTEQNFLLGVGAIDESSFAWRIGFHELKHFC